MDPETAYTIAFLITGDRLDASIAREKAIRQYQVCTVCGDRFDAGEHKVLDGTDVMHVQCAEACADIGYTEAQVW